MQKDFSFTFNNQEHDALIVSDDLSALPTFVLIHGGGTGSKERMHTYSGVLAKKGISMLSFDQSGAGKDKDNIKQSSLERRTNEAIYAITNFASKEPLVIAGSSMGGELAIRMLEHFPVKSLILLGPAIYDQAAFSLKFGEGFTEVIRTEGSWKNSRALPLLDQFTGKLLIIIGEHDEVIPPGVIEALDSHSRNASQKEIYRIPGCPHRYQEWLQNHPEELQKVAENVAAFSL
jgi:pimeloyl-ACP methyl ester carboxylesterase